MGSARGGPATNIHALVGAEGHPVKVELTAGQAGDAPAAEQMLLLVAPGAYVIADRAGACPRAGRRPEPGEADAIRGACAARWVSADIAHRFIRTDRRAFSVRVREQCYLIARFFNRIK